MASLSLSLSKKTDIYSLPAGFELNVLASRVAADLNYTYQKQLIKYKKYDIQ